MTTMKTKPVDSIIFDMDGTLWDAVDSYCAIWNETYRRIGHPELTAGRQQLLECMGLPIEEIARRLLPEEVDVHQFYSTLRQVDDELMPRLGGKLYPGVSDLMPMLAGRLPLFMVSNCGANGLVYFLDYTGLKPYITATRTHGGTGLDKEHNIAALMKEHGLQRPLYVGDTEGDCRSSHAAGVEMLHVTYGFGQAPDADFSASTFAEATDIINRLSEPN